MRLVYLDKKGNDHDTSGWCYYTLSGGSEVGDTIQTKQVKFPSFEDCDVTVDTPGNVGLSAAYENINTLLRNRWGIERERSILIGILED
jgi:hypothetical protein